MKQRVVKIEMSMNPATANVPGLIEAAKMFAEAKLVGSAMREPKS